MPMESNLHGPRQEVGAPWVLEMVRKEAIARYGTEALTGGYRVTTTIDARMQAAAERAVRRGLREYDRRHGYRGPVQADLLRNLRAEGHRTDAELLEYLDSLPQVADARPALVMSFGEAGEVEVLVQGAARTELPWERVRRRPYVSENEVGPQPDGPADMFAVGDLILVRDADEGGLELTQRPEAQGALVAINPHDGGIVALVGGYDFRHSKFNRAVDALRQPGSVFKPFIYSAALDHGLTAATVVNDAPVVIQDPTSETVWRPKNNSGSFNGPTRLREALVRSIGSRSSAGGPERHHRPYRRFRPAGLLPAGKLFPGTGFRRRPSAADCPRLCCFGQRRISRRTLAHRAGGAGRTALPGRCGRCLPVL